MNKSINHNLRQEGASCTTFKDIKLYLHVRSNFIITITSSFKLLHKTSQSDQLRFYLAPPKQSCLEQTPPTQQETPCTAAAPT